MSESKHARPERMASIAARRGCRAWVVTALLGAALAAPFGAAAAARQPLVVAADPRATPQMDPSRISPVRLHSLTFNTASVTGGLPVTGTVAMTGPTPPGGVTVNLFVTSRSGQLVSAPATVRLAGPSSANFVVATSGVAAQTAVTISASYGGVTRTATLTLVPASLDALGCSPASIYGGDTVSCTVTLTGAPPPGGFTVALTSSAPAIVAVPATVVIAQTANTGKGPLASSIGFATFSVSTQPVSQTTAVKVAAEKKTATLTVRAPVISAVTCTPTSVTGGNPAACRASLTSRAPEGGVQVGLSSSLPAVLSVPTNVTITQMIADFTATTVPVDGPQSATITASYGGEKRVTVSVAPPPRPDLHLHTITFFDAQSGQGINGPAAGQAFTMCLNVVNSGAGPASANTLRVQMYRSGAGLVQTWERPLPALASGTGGNPCLDAPELAAGSTYDFNIYVDAANAVTESNENNNFFVWTRGL